MLAPIVCFVYNRPWHTRQVMEALKNSTLAKDSELFIFSDAAKNEAALPAVNEVRKYISGIAGFKKMYIFENKENVGGHLFAIKPISEVIAQYGKVISLDDDIVTAPLFLKYMNEALDIFEKDERIWSITGYSLMKIYPAYAYDVYLACRHCSSGWGMWKDRWESIDWEKTGSEAIFKDAQIRKSFCKAGEDVAATLANNPDAYDTAVYYTQWKQGKYTVYPVHSLATNIGFDGSGIHFTSPTKKYDVAMHNIPVKINKNIQPDEKILRAMKKFYTKSWYRKCMIWGAKKAGIYTFLRKHFA
jgi:hypothetical protein